MAASVIRTLSGFGPSHPAQTCFIPADEDELDDEYEDELRDEVEDSFEEEEDDSTGVESHITDPSASDLYSEITTDRLLRFAELISSDVQRYFGRSQDSDMCDMYVGRSRHEVTGRQRYYSDIVRAASSEPGDESENLGPLAELFQSAQVKKQGLPMIQRRLPSSFWTEPRPEHLCITSNIPDVMTCSTETMNLNGSVPVISMSSSATPDFSDLLEHWASDRETCSDYSCEYQLP
ncbi:protein PERCC1 [Hemibagrus wyckioides]|nr:protein PERCC1 [Hemibagrus wyckioides]